MENLFQTYDCGVIEGDRSLIDPDDYACLAGPKGQGGGCQTCELHLAWWQLDQAEQALAAAGVPGPYPWERPIGTAGLPDLS